MVSASHHVFCTTFFACTPPVSVDEVPSKGTRGDGVGVGVGVGGVEASVTGAFFSVSTAFDAVTASRSPVALVSVSALVSRSSRGAPADAKPRD